MSLDEWGILGKMEWVRQVLYEEHETGLTRAELCHRFSIKPTSLETFLMQLTRYCYLYEWTDERGRLRYAVDPTGDDGFERRILPYDKIDRDYI